ncbi:hypothetical protein [Phaeospirillum tilakii]|uniref:Uncharacterized protein n=1 Tax=Phaeospirillum tilakii TaxID=741673 RepID=A0ABW5C9E1_9PROT
MSMSSIVIVSVAAAVFLVIGGGLLMYMSNLVRSAYELKVQIAADVEARFAKMTEEFEKKGRWIKRDLIEEVEKIKAAVETENARRFQTFSEPVTRAVEGLDSLIRNERKEWVAAIERDRGLIAQLDSRVDFLRRDLKALAGPAPVPAPAPAPVPAPAAGEASDPAPADDAAEAALAAGPADPVAMSEFLPDLGRKA